MGAPRPRADSDRLARGLSRGLYEADGGDGRGSDHPGSVESESGRAPRRRRPVRSGRPAENAPPIRLSPLLPTLVVVGTAMLVLLLVPHPPRDSRAHLGTLALAGLVCPVLAALGRWCTDGRAFR